MHSIPIENLNNTGLSAIFLKGHVSSFLITFILGPFFDEFYNKRQWIAIYSTCREEVLRKLSANSSYEELEYVFQML